MLTSARFHSTIVIGMKKLKLAVWVVVACLGVDAGWQIANIEIANAELQDDMKDIAWHLGGRSGLSDTSSDEEYRNAVLERADKYEIPLNANQIRVQRTGIGKDTIIYLAAEYQTQVHIPGYAYTMYFNPATDK